MSFRTALSTAAILCLAPLTGLAAQQALVAPATAAPAVTPAATTPAPQNSALFGRTESAVTPSTASDRAEMAAPSENHTVVISTVGILLIVIILILLIK